MYVLYKYDDNHYKMTLQQDRRLNTKKSNVVTYSDNPDNDICKIAVTDRAELKRIQISRTKRMIYEYSKCNDFRFFGTITIDSKLCDRFSLEKVFALLRKTINQLKNKYHWKKDDFRYLIICEKHKNGAFHFHGLFSSILEDDLYINSNSYLSSTYFDRMGFNSWSVIENKEACSCYIQKYITKDFVSSIGGSTYICSRGLKRAESYEIVDLCNYNAFDKYDFENEYCKIKNIDLYKNPDEAFYLSFVVKYNDNYTKKNLLLTAKNFINFIDKKYRL